MLKKFELLFFVKSGKKNDEKEKKTKFIPNLTNILSQA